MTKLTISSKPPIWLLTLVRVLIGWHFLYEGLVKLLNPNWSAAPFLMESTWIFSGLFKSMAANPDVLAVVNFLNIWGLILIGLGLFFGLLTRISAISGALLLSFYFVAQPPFTGFMLTGNTEGSYVWVNKIIIELITLLLIFKTPRQWLYSFDNLFYDLKQTKTEKKKNKAVEIPKTDNPTAPGAGTATDPNLTLSI